MPPPDLTELRPALAAHARLRDDPITGKKLLLYPEGALELDMTGAAILELCDGTRTLNQIALELTTHFEGDETVIRHDATECLEALAARGLIRFEPVAP